MGDLPRAGAYWLLTERIGSDVEMAVAAFYERSSRRPVAVRNALPRGTEIEAYPPAVQERLRALELELKPYAIRWADKTSRSHPRSRESWATGLPGVLQAIAVALFIGAVIGLIGLGLFGAIFVTLFLVSRLLQLFGVPFEFP